MPTVFDNIETPGTAWAVGRRVDVFLVASASDSAVGGVVDASNITIMDRVTGYADSLGHVAFNLRANATIEPANTWYAWQTHLADGRVDTRLIRVPDGAGPYHVADIEITSPAAPLLPGDSIQDAIDDAAAAGGGDVYLAGGTFDIATPIVLPSLVHLRGSGVGSTRLRLADGADTEVIISEDFATLTGTDSTDGIYQFGIHDMTIDGNRANQSVAHAAVALYGFDFDIERVRISSALGTGLYTEWSSSAAAPLPNVSMEARMADVKVDDCGEHGIDWNGPHDSKWDAVTTWENSQSASGFSGMLIRTNGGGLQATNCHSWGGNQWDAVHLAANACLFSNCIAEGAEHAQVQLAAHDCMWDGQVYAVPVGAVAFSLGDTGAPAAGCKIRGTSLTATLAGSTAGRVVFFFDEDGGNHIDLNNYETAAGTPISGSAPHADTSILIRGQGGGGSLVSNLLAGAKPTITGSKGGNAALTSLLAALDDAGIVIDSSS